MKTTLLFSALTMMTFGLGGCAVAPEGSDDADGVETGTSEQAQNAPTVCTIQTFDGHYLSAVGGGGRTNDVIHTDATRVGSWEKFTLVDPGEGSPIPYGVKTKSGHYLTVMGGGGRTNDVIHSDATHFYAWERITFDSLGGGWYAIKTVDGHYLSAINGGGLITDTIHSDATVVRNWEKFRLNCGLR